MKQLDLFSATEITPIQNMEFDYNKGDFKKTDVIQKIKPVAIPKVELKVIKTNRIFDYIIECIDPSGYDITAETDYEKVKFLNDTFQNEFWSSHKNYFKTELLGFADWIPGLPSCFNCDYANHLILEVALKLGSIAENLTEDQEEEFLNNWYNLIAENFIKLREEMETQKPLSTLAIDTLKNSKVEGMVVKLPEVQLDRKIYTEVKTKLELIGGKWKGNKVMGFVFNEDPTGLLSEIANGGNRNLKKEFQFFGTPDGLCDRLVELAEINDSHDILEPSAGQGAIIKAIHKVTSNTVDCYEAMNVNKLFLDKLPNINFLGEDFLKHEGKQYDRIIANPPFSKNQDIDHVMKMWDCLKFGGRIVSITSKHWQMSSNKKETAFKDFLKLYNAEIIEIEAGEFKESGTSIATVILVIDKLM